MLRALTISGTPTFVRVSQADHGEIGRALDGGAHGVVVPQIGSVEEAQLVARACRYAPAGARSIGPTPAKPYDRPHPRAPGAAAPRPPAGGGAVGPGPADDRVAGRPGCGRGDRGGRGRRRAVRRPRRPRARP